MYRLPNYFKAVGGARYLVSCARPLTRSLITKSANAQVVIAPRKFSTVDHKFTDVLHNEIKQEQDASTKAAPPTGFAVADRNGPEVTLTREYQDGVVSTDYDESGDAGNSADTDNSAEAGPLEARPDIRIRLLKPTGRAILFNCSLPNKDVQDQLTSGAESNLPTYSVDSVEMEQVPGYFVFTDLFDDQVYDNTMQLLMDRDLDAKFQKQLQQYCTSEEHQLYVKFLEEFRNYCKE